MRYRIKGPGKTCSRVGNSCAVDDDEVRPGLRSSAIGSEAMIDVKKHPILVQVSFVIPDLQVMSLLHKSLFPGSVLSYLRPAWQETTSKCQLELVVR